MDTLKRDARIAGLFYLGLMTAPLRLEYIPAKLIVSGNAAATAANIAAHQTLFRLGILSDLFTGTMAIFLTLAFFRLFKDVDRDLARLVVILGALMVTPIYFVNTINDVATLTLVRGAEFLNAFSQPQREALAMLFLKLHGAGIAANEVFWGLWLFPLGLLAYRSRFIPRVIGAWLMVNCFAYLALSVTAVMWPQYTSNVYSAVFPVMLGELAMMLWLLIVGAKERRMPAALSAPALPS
jgi:Domain of unknown function (DUF4386)